MDYQPRGRFDVEVVVRVYKLAYNNPLPKEPVIEAGSLAAQQIGNLVIGKARSTARNAGCDPDQSDYVITLEDSNPIVLSASS